MYSPCITLVSPLEDAGRSNLGSEKEIRAQLKEAWGSLPSWRTFKAFMKGRGAALGDRPGKPLEYDLEVVRDLSHHQPLSVFCEGRDMDWRDLKKLSGEVELLKIGRFKLVPPAQVAKIVRALNKSA